MLPTNRWNHADFGTCPCSNHIQHLLSTCHSSLLSNNHLTLYSIHLSTSSHVGTNSYCTLSTSSRLHILQGLTDHPCLPLTQLCSHSPYSLLIPFALPLPSFLTSSCPYLPFAAAPTACLHPSQNPWPPCNAFCFLPYKFQQGEEGGKHQYRKNLLG